MNVLEHPVISEPTHAHIMDLLEEQTQEAESLGVQVMRPELFCPEADVAQVRDAHAWWPRECPANLGWATSFGGSLAMQRTAVNTETLLTHLGRCAQRTAAWLRSEGRDVDYPNETKAERMRRRNRERVAEHRTAHRTAPDGERPATSVAWEAVVTARAERARVLAEHDARVRRAYDLMTRRSEARKVAKADQDQLVAQAEAAHQRAKDHK